MIEPLTIGLGALVVVAADVTQGLVRRRHHAVQARYLRARVENDTFWAEEDDDFNRLVALDLAQTDYNAAKTALDAARAQIRALEQQLAHYVTGSPALDPMKDAYVIPKALIHQLGPVELARRLTAAAGGQSIAEVNRALGARNQEAANRAAEWVMQCHDKRRIR